MMRLPAVPLGSVALALVAATGASSAARAAGDDPGAVAYAHCAACHGQNGAGVPGAFPPLQRNFLRHADTPRGRQYLVLVLSYGLNGPIVVAGKTYRGVMPAQGWLDNAALAAVLNHIGKKIAPTTDEGSSFLPFTAQEVAAIRADTGVQDGAAVARMHAEISK